MKPGTSLRAGASPELQALFSFARRFVTGASSAATEDPEPSRLHPDEVIRVAIWHGMLPLLAQEVSTQPPTFSAASRERLRKLQLQSLQHSLSLSVKLLEIVAALEARGIACFPFKGPTLSARLYGDLALRPCSDIDVFVHPEDLPRAITVLLDRRFVLPAHITPNRIPALTQNDFELPLQRDDLHLDLHWGVLPPFYGIPFAIDAAFQRARPFAFEGRQLLALSPVDEFLALALHASKHLWSKLIWIVDLALMLRSHPDLQVPDLIRRARELRMEHLVRIALALVQNVLHFPQEPPSAATEAPSRAAYAIATTSLCRSQGDPEGLERNWFFLRARDNAFDAAAQLVRQAITPASVEWKMTSKPLPAVLYLPLHLWRIASGLRPRRSKKAEEQARSQTPL